MAEMMSYAIDLRSMTQSRGTFTFNFVRYEDCPAAAPVSYTHLDVYKRQGMERLRIMSFSYVVSPLMDASIAASRGIGKSVVPTVIVVMGSCVFRVIWVYTIFAWFGTITSLYLLYIFSLSLIHISTD